MKTWMNAMDINMDQLLTTITPQWSILTPLVVTVAKFSKLRQRNWISEDQQVMTHPETIGE